MINIFFKIIIFCCVIVLGVGCSSKKDAEPEAESGVGGEDVAIAGTDQAQQLSDNTVFELNGLVGEYQIGAMPASEGSATPALISSPDSVDTTGGRVDRIDIVFSVDSDLGEVYVGVVGADGYYVFSEPAGTKTDNLEAVSLTVDVPENIENGQYCLSVGAKDGEQQIADAAEVCLTITDTPEPQREIYFANFDDDSTLSTLNFDSGSVASIGATGFQLTDLAFSGQVLYGVTFTQLIKIDPETGAGELLGEIGVSGVNALESIDGVLYGATMSGELLTIDPNNGQGELIGQYPPGALSSGDLVYNPASQRLYGTVKVGDSPADQITAIDQLALIDPVTGDVELLGETGFYNVYGLAIMRGQLLGLTDGGEYIVIDTNTGVGALIERTPALSASGAAAKPRS